MPEEQARSGQDTITLDCDLAELDRLQEFIDAFCGRTALPEQVSNHVGVALEELVVNAVKHGRCERSTAAIRIGLRLDGDRLRIAFSDSGVPFDPLAMPAPDLNADLGRRPIGGLGIHLVRCLMPEIRYERRDGRNYLFLSTPIERHAELARP